MARGRLHAGAVNIFSSAVQCEAEAVTLTGQGRRNLRIVEMREFYSREAKRKDGNTDASRNGSSGRPR